MTLLSPTYLLVTKIVLPLLLPVIVVVAMIDVGPRG